jgi:hypothetical protein
MERKVSFSWEMVLITVLANFSCTTIQIPLPGSSVMRPRAGLGDVGARITVGAAKAPSIEGTISEVKDENGFVINPLPGDAVAEDLDTESTTPIPVIELGVDWSERYEFGLSTVRGVFFMWDYALWENAALTITPSYSSVSAEGGEPKLDTKTNEDGEETLTVDYGFKGEASNFNLTQLASVFVGKLQWIAAYFYAGIGLNSYSASINHKKSGATNKSSQVAPTYLYGTHLRLLIFELTAEKSMTQIKYRDGIDKMVPASAVTFSLHISL